MSEKVGKNMLFYGKVEIGKNGMIQDNVIIGSSDDGTVEIGESAIIRSGTVIYSGVKIGKNLRTGHNILIRENTEIGEDVLIGTNSVVDGNCNWLTPFKIQEINIATKEKFIKGLFIDQKVSGYSKYKEDGSIKSNYRR